MNAFIVVPIYNHERYIQETIKSISQNIYFEESSTIVLIDDGSQDKSFDKAQDASKKYLSQHNVILEKQTNIGAAKTINKAIIKYATDKDLIFILNSDDTYGNGRIKRILDICKDDEHPMLWGFTNVNSLSDFKRKHSELKYTLDSYPSISFALLFYNYTISTGNLFFKKNLFDEINGFDTSLEYCHDWKFALTASLLYEPIYLHDVFYRYRKHGSNTFLKLEHLAHEETRKIIDFYFSNYSIRSNPLAPGPHWGERFSHYMTQHGFWPFLD